MNKQIKQILILTQAQANEMDDNCRDILWDKLAAQFIINDDNKGWCADAEIEAKTAKNAVKRFVKKFADLTEYFPALAGWFDTMQESVTNGIFEESVNDDAKNGYSWGVEWIQPLQGQKESYYIWLNAKGVFAE